MSVGFELERIDRAIVFRICRPKQANAFDRNTLLALGDTARMAASDASVRCLIVTGQGAKHFCAGADLHERHGWSTEQVREQLQLYRSELGALDRCAVPTVAAINGTCLGGGLEIALACDLRTATANATFALPECGLGIIPGAGGTQRLPRLIGPARTKQMILLGTRINASQALDWGLVNRICPDGSELIHDTLDWLEPILNGAPIAHEAALCAVDASELPLNEGLTIEAKLYDRALVSNDRNEGLRAFVERRPPKFLGK